MESVAGAAHDHKFERSVRARRILKNTSSLTYLLQVDDVRTPLDCGSPDRRP